MVSVHTESPGAKSTRRLTGIVALSTSFPLLLLVVVVAAVLLAVQLARLLLADDARLVALLEEGHAAEQLRDARLLRGGHAPGERAGRAQRHRERASPAWPGAASRAAA